MEDAKYDAFLVEDEVVVYSCRKHFIVLSKAMFIFLVGVLVSIVAGLLFGKLAFWIFFLDDLYVGWLMVDWWFYEYVITTKRILKISGVLGRHVETVPIRKITDTSYRRTLLGRMLNYGDLILDVAGQDRYLPVLDKVGNVSHVYKTIMSIALGGRGRIVGPPDPRRMQHSQWHVEGLDPVD